MKDKRDLPLSVHMRDYLADLREFYDQAKQEDNGALVDKFGKAMTDQAKKLREQERYEGELIDRAELRRAGKLTGDLITRVVEAHIDEALALRVIDEIRRGLAVISENKELQ